MPPKTSTLCRLVVGATFVVTSVVTGQPTDAVPIYSASYDASYKGRSVGSFELSVNREESTKIYTFESAARFRGLLRLFTPKPVTEVSRFTYENGRIRPLEYRYDDGTRKGDDNYRVVFDWENRLATTTAENEPIESELSAGFLDRATMQVAVMLDMRSSGPERYTLVEEDGVRVYEYTADGEETLETPLGAIASQKFIQQRPGSSRRTLMWMAPELNFLPVRIEQQRDGVTRAAFDLRSVEWLETGR